MTKCSKITSIRPKVLTSISEYFSWTMFVTKSWKLYYQTEFVIWRVVENVARTEPFPIAFFLGLKHASVGNFTKISRKFWFVDWRKEYADKNQTAGKRTGRQAWKKKRSWTDGCNKTWVYFNSFWVLLPPAQTWYTSLRLLWLGNWLKKIKREFPSF